MKLVPLAIAALGPLTFPERKPGVQFRSSLPYVPGAAIYGALGALLGKQLDGTEFAALFRNIRCHNAYPALDGDLWSHPLPMTAIQPKKSSDEKKQAKRTARNKGLPYRPYQESLYARVCWERQQPAALIYAPVDHEGRPWEVAERTFYTFERANGSAWLQNNGLISAGIGTREVTQRVLTRVAINRRRGTAEDSRLYSPLVISEVMEDRCKKLTATRFLGSIVVPDGDTQILAALKDITYIGGRQTTGIGAVEISQQQEAAPAAAAISERVATMTKRFQEQAALYQALGGTPWQVGAIFTVNLLSDAILLDQGWLPTNELNGALLKELTGVDATLIRSFTTTTTVGGWNVSWQRPKPTAVATNMGSLFVFQAEGELSPADYDALATLERGGIGERRAEGYGQVRICDEFHLLPE